MTVINLFNSDAGIGETRLTIEHIKTHRHTITLTKGSSYTTDGGTKTNIVEENTALLIYPTTKTPIRIIQEQGTMYGILSKSISLSSEVETIVQEIEPTIWTKAYFDTTKETPIYYADIMITSSFISYTQMLYSKITKIHTNPKIEDIKLLTILKYKNGIKARVYTETKIETNIEINFTIIDY